jgi:predicted dehydrogenase
MIRWVTGQEIEQVYAVSRTKLSSPDDYLIANLRLDNGIDAVLEVSWCGPPVSGTAKHAVFEVRGSQGHVELEDFEMNVRVFEANNAVTAPDTYEHYDLHGQKDGYFKNMIDQFMRALENPSRLSNSLSDAMEATRVCAMIRKSLDEERVVRRIEFL